MENSEQIVFRGIERKRESSCQENASKVFETILYKVDDYNLYQWKLMFICGFCGIFTGFHNMGAVFLAATPEHWCKIPSLKENISTNQKALLNFTVPWELSTNGVSEPSKCKYYDRDYSTIFNSNYSSMNAVPSTVFSVELLPGAEEKSCESWIYDDTIYKSTMVSEWDLVCERHWLKSSTQASYMMGVLTGAVIISTVSDRIGRRPASLICCCLFFVASVSAAFTSSFSLFLILRFIVAGAGQGMFLANYILLMETVSLKGRNVMSNLFHIFFGVGFTFLSLIGYLFREWRSLQLAISLPTAILLGYYWLLPESPRWLLMHGKEEEGIKVLKSIAKCNGKTFPTDVELKPMLTIISKEIGVEETNSMKSRIKTIAHLMLSLFRTPNIRRRSLIICYCWFVTSMVYYGLSFSGANLNASVYVASALSGAAEIPSSFIVMLLLFRFGRRPVLCASFLFGGVACMGIIFVPSDMVGLNLALATIGKSCLTNSFLLVFIFSAELVPTHVRNIAIGIASMCARIGSAIAPFIVDLLGAVYNAIPSTIFGILAVIASLLCLLLPETGERRLPESIDEIEAMPR